MGYLSLHRIAAVLLALGTCGHTFGGMLKTSRGGPNAGPEADQALATMKAVHFRWQGSSCSWHDFLMGNGFGVSALLVLAVVVLWVLGGLPPEARGPALPIAWAAFVSVALLAAIGFRYFAPPVGAVFGLVALLIGVAALRWTLAG
jgi:hypothetical protein